MIHTKSVWYFKLQFLLYATLNNLLCALKIHRQYQLRALLEEKFCMHSKQLSSPPVTNKNPYLPLTKVIEEGA